MTTDLWEVLEVEAGGPAAGLLVPGRVLRALALGAEVLAEEVGLMTPGRRGELVIEIARHRASRIATPRRLPSIEGDRPALFVLRRADDAADPDEARELTITWDDGGAPPAPGELAVALAEATGHSADELGFGLAGAGHLRVQVPLGLALALALPLTLSVGQRTLRVEADARKKA